MVNSVIRILTILLFLIRWWYWKKEEGITERQKPKSAHFSFYTTISRILFLIMYYGMLMQVIGLQVLPFQQFSLHTSLLGFLFVSVGVALDIVARKQLGNNWTNGYEYQIKEKHELVTTGVYAYIRHPIYSGLFLSFIGGELVAQSYLWISALAFLIASYLQGKREEKILLLHFGKKYEEYIHRTKMLIPYLL